jgi:hypothetical protein
MAMFFMCAFSYTTEWNNRLQFLSNQQLIIFNSKLQRQLRGLEHSYSTTIADLESPLEKAIASIKLLLASPHITGSQIRILHEILVCLNSSHLMAPDLYHQVTSGEVVMDKEEEVKQKLSIPHQYSNPLFFLLLFLFRNGYLMNWCVLRKILFHFCLE